MSFTVAPIVEGHGDVAAVPVLLRLMAPQIRVARPVRFKRNQLLMDEYLTRAARIADANVQENGAVLLIMDADEDCAAALAPERQGALSRILPHRMCRVVLAVKEFEAWIVGGDPAYGVGDADSAGALKERIKRQRGVYSETADQPKLIARADLLRLQQTSRSFRRLRKCVDEFVATAAGVP